MAIVRNAASFRDPSGFIYSDNGVLYRQVNECYHGEYDLLMESGLYDELTSSGMMLPHEEVNSPLPPGAYKILRPEKIHFISYPHEWCFSQLKDAAFLTLEIQKRALAHGMSLKDASAFNIQFVHGKPLLIDTLSFERHQDGKPWTAYRQFCMHFLAPLALMSFCDVRLGGWFRISVDGVPLEMASSLLPIGARMRPSLFMHLVLHARSQKRYAGKELSKKKLESRISKFSLLALIDSLEGAVSSLEWKPRNSEWMAYYEDTNYTVNAFERKKEAVAELLDISKPKSLWDLGANDGTFSRIATSMGIQTIAFDIDLACVEKNYLKIKAEHENNLLPLFQDLTNPSSGSGWANEERMSLPSRGPSDAVLALAVIHHLAISNNVPLSMISEFFSSLCRWLIIEFVPKQDSQVQRLLATREDIFDKYDVENFEMEFGRHFRIVRKCNIEGSFRVLYLLEKNQG